MKYLSLSRLWFFILSLLSTPILADHIFTHNPPVLITPNSTNPTEQQNGTVSFKWNEVPTAEVYEIIAFPLDLQGNVIGTAMIDESLFATECNNGECILERAVFVKKAKWRVRAIRFTDTTPVVKERVNSEYQDFTLATDPPLLEPPIALSPSGPFTKHNETISFQWQVLSAAGSYQVSFSSVNATGDTIWGPPIITTASEVGCNISNTTCSVSLSAPANTSGWKVGGITPDNLEGGLSSPLSFSLLNPVSYPSYFPTTISYPDWTSKEGVNKAANMPTPGFQQIEVDNDTAQSVWRLGGSSAEMGGQLPHPTGNSISGQHSQHFYSKTNAVNKDETYVLGSAGSTTHAALWKLSTKQLVAWVPADPSGHFQQRQLLWDKNISNVYWYTSGTKLYRAEIDFETYSISTSPELWDTFNEFEYITFGLGEGDFSDDGTKIVLVGKNHDNDDHTIISYLVPTKNKSTAKKLSELLPNETSPLLDWSSVDPTGEYILLNQLNDDNRKTLVIPFDQNPVAPRVLYHHAKHSDFVIDNNNESWIVYGTWQGVFASKLSAPLLKQVWPVSSYIGSPVDIPRAEVSITTIKTASGHVSRVANIPGLVLVSRHIDGGLYYINIDEPGKTRYVGNSRHGKRPAGHAQSKADWGVNTDGEPTRYLREPRPSASASGDYVLFASDYHIHGTGYDTSPPPEFKAHLNMIEVTPSPIATDDGVVNVTEDTPKNITVLDNDSDPDADALGIISVTTPAHGTATINANSNADNSIQYIPDTNYFGADTFDYTISDGEDGADSATVTINVVSVNDAPSVASPIGNQISEDAATVTINVSENFSDPEEDTLNYSTADLPSGLSIDSVTGVISGTIDKSASQEITGGVYTVSVTVIDSSNAEATDWFTWAVTNPAPQATADAGINVIEDIAQDIIVLINDSDPDGDTLSVITTTTPAHGSTIINVNNTIKYIPDADYNGADTFAYTLSDNEGGTDIATVTINVVSVNDQPQIVTPITDQTNVDAATPNIDLSTSFLDTDGDLLLFSASGLPDGLTISTTTGVVSGTIDNAASQNGVSGVYNVTISAKDPSNSEVTNTFIWTVTNPAPIGANDDAFIVLPLVTRNLAVLINDYDIDGDTLSITHITDSANPETPVVIVIVIGVPLELESGTIIELLSNGSLDITPASDMPTSETFDYTLSDGNGGTSTATVTITQQTDENVKTNGAIFIIPIIQLLLDD